MPAVHFQSIYRRYGLTISEPLCGPGREGTDYTASPRRDEVTCSHCLRFLMCVKESSNV